jgi:hypothetical protein
MPKNKNPHTRLKLIYDFICEGYEPGKKNNTKASTRAGFQGK